MSSIQPSIFELPFGTSLLRGDRYPGECNAVVLHGAGQSSRERFARLRRSLYNKGMPSVSFDFIGHGETGGSLLGSTLHSRTEQASAVIQHAGREPLTLIAASMSGYTAIKLLKFFAVEHLILLVPAVYTHRAYDIPFGSAFSTAIRKPGSWRDSDAFRILPAFKGNLLIIAAESDDVIPREVIERIYAAADNARVRHRHIVPGSRHGSLFPRDRDFHLALDMITSTCRKTKDNRAIKRPPQP